MATLFAKNTNGDMTLEEFKSECSVFEDYLDTWYDRLNPVLRNDQHLVKSYDDKIEAAEDIVNNLGGLYRGPLVTLNFMIADWINIRAMFGYKKASVLRQNPPSELPN